jgi:hypothetical protein
MPIKLKLGVIASQSFVFAMQKLGTMPLTFNEGAAVAVCIKFVDEQLAIFKAAELAARKKYGVLDQASGQFIDANKSAQYQKELAEMMDQDVTLPISAKILLDPDASDKAGVLFTPFEHSVLTTIAEPKAKS